MNISAEHIKDALSEKRISITAENIQKFRKHYLASINKIYNVVCLDIDGTICKYDRNTPTKEIIETISKLVLKNSLIVFITGRGRKGSKTFLRELRRKIISNCKGEIDPTYFRRRWFCITHSGLFLLHTIGDGNNDFLQEDKLLMQNEKWQTVSKIKSRIYQNLLRNIETLKSLHEALNHAQLSIKEVLTEEPAGLRIVLPYETKEVLFMQIKKELLELSNEFSEKGFSRVLSGRYLNKKVIELTYCDKGDAILETSLFLGIEENKILRIGDKGGKGESDYAMLHSQEGFSVSSYSNDLSTCKPVLNEEGQIIKGLEATTFLLQTLKIFPSISVKLSTKTKVFNELATFEDKAFERSRDQLVYYSNLLAPNLNLDNFKTNNFYLLDTYDIKSGGIKFRDYEWNLIKDNNKLKKVFNSRVRRTDDYKFGEPLFKYILKTDSGIILRGAHCYYYGLAYRDKSDNQWQYSWINHFQEFLDLSMNAIDGSDIDIYSTSNRKMILAVIDNVRNFLLVVLNSYLNTNNENSYIYHFYNEEVSSIKNEFLEFTIKNTEFLHACMFDGLYPFPLNTYHNFLSKVNDLLKQHKQDILEIIKKRHLRIWRETDFFVENLASINSAILKIRRKLGASSKTVHLHGLLYGGIELPIIAKILLNKMGINVKISFHKFNTSYQRRQNTSISSLTTNFVPELSANDLHIILDDNIMTGATCQIVLNEFYKISIQPDNVFFVRYPSVNRLPQMFFEGHSAPDFSLFDTFILGLISPTPYTRIFSKNMGKNPYLDKTGMFNRSRFRICRYLFKNGLYNNEEIKKEFEDIG